MRRFYQGQAGIYNEDASIGAHNLMYLLQDSERFLHGSSTLVAVHQVFPTVVQHKENVEDLIEAVCTARCRLPCLSPMPVDLDTCFIQVCQQQSTLDQRTLKQRPNWASEQHQFKSPSEKFKSVNHTNSS